MPQLSLITLTTKQEEKNRKLLLESIKKRRLVLKKLVVRSEMLKVRLDMLKREYMVKIGSLVVKDNHLDLEIIRLRNISALIKEGMSYEDAVKEIEGTFYAEQLEIEKEEEKVRFQKQIFDKQSEVKSEETLKNAKKLWRKLITMFHPDLIQEPVEKKRREGIMKQINEAYEMGDYIGLARIEREHGVSDETSMQSLEEILVLIENEIVEQELFFEELKRSEWYRFETRLIKTKKTLDEIYAEVEKKLLGDILAKFQIIKEFESQIKNLKVAV